MNNDILIYDFDYLNLSEKALKLAKNMLSECDTPIVVWLNSDCNVNYRGINKGQQNQYWAIVNQDNRSTDYERLVLAQIRSNYHTQQCFITAKTTNEHLCELIGKDSRLSTYNEFIGMLNSFVCSYEIECYLKTNEISMQETDRRIYYESVLEKLKEYVHLNSDKKMGGTITWYRENRCTHYIEYAKYCTYSTSWRMEIERYLACLKDKKHLSKVRKITNLFMKYKENYDETLAFEQTKSLIENLVKLLNVEDIVELGNDRAISDNHKLGDGKIARVYYCVPDDIQYKQDVLYWVRCSREFISTYRNSCDIMPCDVKIGIIDSQDINSYSNKDENEYIITYPIGLIGYVKKHIDDIQSVPDCLLQSLEEYKLNVFRHVAFFVTAHEYGHILNGDCEGNLEEIESVEIKECKANETAQQCLDKASALYYRFLPDSLYADDATKISDIMNLKIKLKNDSIALKQAKEIINFIVRIKKV